MFNITNYLGNANKNHKEVPSHICYNVYYKKRQEASVGKDGCTAGGNVNYCSHYENSMAIHQKLRIELPYDPGSTSGIYLENEKIIIQKDICSLMFTVALFTIPRTWKQPKCPLIDEWMKKMWYTALDGVGQWIECRPASQGITGSIPSQGICLGCGPGPSRGRVRGNHTLMFLSLFLPPFPPL
ncbi:hypothetical protein HJG60_009361 [Phyllostomus discolor]|uniref:Uncharacterized protein n=1 Tax=Phyllostomus discolor TaxID=89673 RepID=A0A834DCP4_9CHIR|nr:hypothetical protein HJG60_009361 [Phyllostomus discolor]